jgi:hypothetical protein
MRLYKQLLGYADLPQVLGIYEYFMITDTQSETVRWMLFISIVGGITFVGYFVLYPQTLFTPGDSIGYSLGLAGGLTMLMMLLYSLRKRSRLFERLGSLPNWFKWHIVLGILCPLAIIFHSTYHVYIPYIHPTGSLNAAVAMLCMLLVSCSGAFGRFIYTKVHFNFYGRLSTVNELRAGLESFEELKSVFSFAPSVEKALDDFHAHTEGYTKQPSIGFVSIFTVGYQAMKLSRTLPIEISQIILARAVGNDFGADQREIMERLILSYKERIVAYLDAVREVSQFSTYERLFAVWHIFHVPLVYMLVFSAVYHVYAVHFY